MPLRIAPDLALPDDVVTQSIAILARRGAGKTYTATVLVEEVVRASLPVVVLDPTGAWWGLRSSVDGQSAGMPVVIFGGDHGDVPLEPTAGRVIADVVLDHPGAYIVDLSRFESKAAEQRFAADFLERLYRLKKRESGPLLLVVDEADVFAPQRPGTEQIRTLGALESIVRRGRIKGLGDVLISQRAAVLNKNVLTQTEILVVLQTTGPQDRAAIDDWIAGNGSREQRDAVLGSLASLDRGEAWVWSPSFLRILQRVRIRARATFDSSRTPEAGETAIAPKAFAKVDLAALGERIAATVERSKADDPAELRKRIRDLEQGNQLMAETIKAGPQTVTEGIEIPVLNGQVPELRLAIGELVNAGQRLVEVATAIGDAAAVIQSTGDSITAAIGRVQGYPNVGGQVERAPRGVPEGGRKAPISGSGRGDPAVATLAPAVPSRTPAPVVTGDAPAESVKLKAGARRMLEALASLHPTALTRVQVATLADISPRSGTFSDYMSALRVGGLIAESGNTIALTEAGVALAGGAVGRGAPSPAEMIDMWSRKLKAGARRMLAVLHEVYPDGVDRRELGERAEISSISGTFSDYLSILRGNGLIEEDGGLIRAGAALFLGQR